MYEIGDRTSFGTVIYVSEGASMASSWTDYIFVNKRKDGRFSLKGYKWLEGYREPFHYVWQRIDSVIGIKGEQEFLKAISRIEGSLSVDVNMDDVISVVTDLDPITGSSIRALYEE